MSERDAVERAEEPVTVQSLADDLRELGVETGETLLVHSSMSALGWVVGDAQAVVDGLMRAVTESGTLVVPTYTGQYTNPEGWSNPPVPDEWVETIRAKRPAFRPAVTPTRRIGAVPECFRNYPRAVRSRHPQTSFAAWGADAAEIVADHSLDYGLGDGSPLAEVYERDGRVLMLGTDHDTNTSLHLAEYRADFPKESKTTDTPLLRDGERVHVEIEGFERSTEDFPDVGRAFEDEFGSDESAVRTGAVGATTATLLAQRPLVDFAVEWFEEHR